MALQEDFWRGHDLSPMPLSAFDDPLTGALRHVRTQAGVRTYRRPIGSVIMRRSRGRPPYLRHPSDPQIAPMVDGLRGVGRDVSALTPRKRRMAIAAARDMTTGAFVSRLKEVPKKTADPLLHTADVAEQKWVKAFETAGTEKQAKTLETFKWWLDEWVSAFFGVEGDRPGVGNIFDYFPGMENMFTNPIGFATQMGEIVAHLLSNLGGVLGGGLVAGGESWRWQLRDANGQWIKMGTKVRWISRGLMRTGEVVGSPRQNEVEVRDDRDGAVRRLLSSQVTGLDTPKGDISVPGKDGPVHEGDRVRYQASSWHESWGAPKISDPVVRTGTVTRVSTLGTTKEGLVEVRPDHAPTTIVSATPSLVSVKDVPPPDVQTHWEVLDQRGGLIRPGAMVAVVGPRSITMAAVIDTAPEDVAPFTTPFGNKRGGTYIRVNKPVPTANAGGRISNADSHHVADLIVIDEDDSNPYDRSIMVEKGHIPVMEGTATGKILAFPVAPRLLQDQNGQVYKACPRCAGTGFTFGTMNGGRCSTCSGAGWAKKYPSLDAGRRDVAKAEMAATARVAKKEADKAEKARLRREQSGEPEGFEDRLFSAPSHRILDDLKRAHIDYGYLTVNQVQLALKLLDELDAREAKKTERVAAGIKVPEGRVKVTGRVVSVKVKDTQYGPRPVMLVESPEGWRVWGTVPQAIVGIEEGENVEFTGTIKPSDQDQTFGFFSRPSKAAIIDAPETP